MVRVPKENDLRHLELSRFTAEAFLGLFFFFKSSALIKKIFKLVHKKSFGGVGEALTFLLVKEGNGWRSLLPLPLPPTTTNRNNTTLANFFFFLACTWMLFW